MSGWCLKLKNIAKISLDNYIYPTQESCDWGLRALNNCGDPLPGRAVERPGERGVRAPALPRGALPQPADRQLRAPALSPRHLQGLEERELSTPALPAGESAGRGDGELQVPSMRRGQGQKPG